MNFLSQCFQIDAKRQVGRDRGEYVASMESLTYLSTKQCLIRNLINPVISIRFANVGEQAIVWSNEELSRSLHCYCSASRTNIWIDYSQVNGTIRKCRVCRQYVEGARSNVLWWNIVSYVHQTNVGRD